MQNVVQFPVKQPTQSTEVVDLEFVKWKLGPESVYTITDQILDIIELEVELPIGGPGIKKFEQDLQEFLTAYFNVS